MPSGLTLEDLKHAVADGAVDTVLVCMVDLQGRLIGKRYHADFFLDSGVDESHACDYLLANDLEMEPVPGYAAASWEQGYGDFTMKPDLGTLRLIPWLPATALVLCDVLDHHGNDLAHSPRGILKKQLARLSEKGFQASCASELEFYLYDESFRSAHDKGYRELRSAGYYIEDYNILQTTREEPFMRAVRKGLDGAGIPVENSKGEWGPGQVEINVRYAEALAMADRHVVLKNGIKEIADGQGRAVTFMAKPAYDLAGSSSHVHMSLWNADGSTAFFDEKDEHGMSKTMRHFVAGLLRYSDDVTYLLAPYINSYKRFQAGTFAPTKAIWSLDNRTAGYRLCSAGSKSIRIECRIGGADLNPYLAFAGLFAAGLAGMNERLELEAPFTGDAYGGGELPEVPKTLRASLDAFEASQMLREAFGDQALEHLAHTGRWEQSEYDKRVTDWEVQRGFERA